MKLNEQVAELESYVPKMELLEPSVSSASVGWQIDHDLRVLSGVLQSIRQEPIKTFQPKFSFKKSIIFALGIIPRGKVKAPKQVNNLELISAETLQDIFSKTKYLLSKWRSIPENHFFSHHIFGDLSKQKTERFLEIHTQHHLNIIRDIIKVK